MVEADFSGSYTNPENCKEGDIAIVTSEGEYQEKKSFSGHLYKQLNMAIEVNGKALTHSPGMMEGRLLVKIWGKDTAMWIGKKAICHVVNYQAQGAIKQKIMLEALTI
jgi:hypothetical protein